MKPQWWCDKSPSGYRVRCTTEIHGASAGASRLIPLNAWNQSPTKTVWLKHVVEVMQADLRNLEERSK